MIIKNRVPVKFLMSVILLFQLLAISILMISIDNTINVQKDLINLNRSKKEWQANDSLFAPSLMAGPEITNEEEDIEFQNNFYQFLLENEKNNNLMLVADSFNDGINSGQYLPGYQQNVLFVTPNYLDEILLDLPMDVKNELEHMADRTYGLLIPEKQSYQKELIQNAWYENLNQGWEPEDQLNLSSITATYPNIEPFFTYRIHYNAAQNTDSFIENPVIVVINANTFKDDRLVVEMFGSFISQQKVLFSDKKQLIDSIDKYQLNSFIGSFTNGLSAVKHKIKELKTLSIYLLFANISALVSALFLMSLLNTCYLYQNRKKFFILTLSGYSFIQIHKKYFIIMTAILLTPLILSQIMNISIYSGMIPIIFLGITLCQLRIQEKAYRKKYGIFERIDYR